MGKAVEGRIVTERVTVRTIEGEVCPVAVGEKGVSWKGSAIVITASESADENAEEVRCDRFIVTVGFGLVEVDLTHQGE